MQSSEDPNPRPLQHTPLQAIPEEGFRTPAEATDEDVRLARRYQGYGGTRFVEDDLAGDPEAGALASNGQGPPSITDRLRSTADGAQAAADLIGAGAAGLAAAQAFRSQLPQDAAEYVRLNVLPRPGPAQPPPQIIGRPSDVERLLDEAGQRAQEVERGGGNRGDGGRGSGGGRGCRCVRQRHERRHSASALHAAHRQQHVRQPASSRASSQSGFRVQAQSNNTPRPFSWGLNPVALPQSQSSRASSSSGQSRRSLPPPSFDQLARCLKK